MYTLYYYSFIHTNQHTFSRTYIHTYIHTSTDEQDSPLNKSTKYKLPEGGSEKTVLQYMGESNTTIQSGLFNKSLTVLLLFLLLLSFFFVLIPPSSSHFSSSHVVSEKIRVSRSSFSQLMQQGVGSLAQALSHGISSTRGSFSGKESLSSSMMPTPTDGSSANTGFHTPASGAVHRILCTSTFDTMYEYF